MTSSSTVTLNVTTPNGQSHFVINADPAVNQQKHRFSNGERYPLSYFLAGLVSRPRPAGQIKRESFQILESIMASPPGRPSAPALQTKNLPPTVNPATASALDDGSAVSPARGREMRTNLIQKLRAPPLVHLWEFYHERQNREGGATSDDYMDRLALLASMSDVREFWSVYNNFDLNKLKMRDSVHLFHKGVKPVWEDPRNLKGGAWTFRVAKDQAEPFWKELCMLAIGEQLQEAVTTKRVRFNDDICGVSLSVRFNSYLVTIWNRDGDNASGIEKLKQTVLDNLPEGLAPKDSYYKKHSEHAGFDEAIKAAQASQPAAPAAAE